MEEGSDEDLILAKEGTLEGLAPSRERVIIRHLPFFVTLGEEENFARASERLGISQSALTRRIQALEQELDTDLFFRGKRSAQMTAAGEAFYEDCAAVMNELRIAVRRAQSISRGEAGDLHVGLNSEAISNPVVMAGLSRLQERCPDIALHLHSMPSEAQLISLKRRDIDLGLFYDVALDDATRRSVNMLRICGAPSLLAVNSQHPLASKAKVYLADLAEIPLTWPPRRAGRSVSDGMIAAFQAVGISPRIAVEVMTDEATLNMAAANLVLGFVRPTSQVPANVVLRQVEDLSFTLSLHAVWMRENAKPNVMQVIEEFQRPASSEQPVAANA